MLLLGPLNILSFRLGMLVGTEHKSHTRHSYTNRVREGIVFGLGCLLDCLKGHIVVCRCIHLFVASIQVFMTPLFRVS
jgi:hypothetical protein